MASQRYTGKSEEYDNEFELERDRYHHSDRNDRRGSPSRSRRHQNRDSRSRSRSVERRRRRRNSSHSRSRSRSRGYGGRRYPVHRHRDSRSHSRSRSGSHKQRSRRYSRTRSPSQDRHPARRNNHRNKESSFDAAPAQTVSYPHGAIGPTSATSLENLPLPAPSRREAIGAYYNLDTEEPIDKARIHREMEEKLRQALAREGKVYPPPKPEASHPVFANDGSFLEIFKKMQQQTGPSTSGTSAPMASAIAAAVAAAPSQATPTAAVIKTAPPPPPLVGRRRGGKILKTGLVAKPKIQTEGNADPKDFWALYLAEVNKYKNNACESDGGTRPLVK